VTVEYGNGKRSVYTARYANEEWAEFHPDYEGDDIDSEGGKKWTGWLEDMRDTYGDDVFRDIEGTVVAWMPMPKALAALTPERKEKVE
jgi:hypothetical protein